MPAVGRRVIGDATVTSTASRLTDPPRTHRHRVALDTAVCSALPGGRADLRALTEQHQLTPPVPGTGRPRSCPVCSVFCSSGRDRRRRARPGRNRPGRRRYRLPRLRRRAAPLGPRPRTPRPRPDHDPAAAPAQGALLGLPGYPRAATGHGTPRRADTTAVIGTALQASAGGAGQRQIAADLARPAVTARRWPRAVRGEPGRRAARQA